MTINKVFLKTCLIKLKVGLLSVSLGDYISQSIEIYSDPEKKFDKKRFVVQASWSFFATPYFMSQYYLLEKFCKVVGLKTLLLNMFFLQFISSPIVYFCYFMHCDLMHSRGAEAGLNTFKERFYDIFINNMKFWPVCNIINFYILPYSFRFYFGQLMSLIWNTYLSYFNYSKSQKSKSTRSME